MKRKSAAAQQTKSAPSRITVTLAPHIAEALAKAAAHRGIRPTTCIQIIVGDFLAQDKTKAIAP